MEYIHTVRNWNKISPLLSAQAAINFEGAAVYFFITIFCYIFFFGYFAF